MRCNRIFSLLVLPVVLLAESALAEDFLAHVSVSKKQLAALSTSAAEFKRSKRKIPVRLTLPTKKGTQEVELVPNEQAQSREPVSFLMTEEGQIEDAQEMDFFKRKGGGKEFVNVALVTNPKTGKKSLHGYMRHARKIYTISSTEDRSFGAMRYSAKEGSAEDIEIAIGELSREDAESAFETCGNSHVHTDDHARFSALLSGDYEVAASGSRPVLETTVGADIDADFYAGAAANGEAANTVARVVLENLVAPVYEQQLQLKLSVQALYTWTSRSVPGYPFGTSTPTVAEVDAAWNQRFAADPAAWAEKRPGFRILFTGRSLGGSVIGVSNNYNFPGGSSIVNAGSRTTMRSKEAIANTTAHEMGHVAGMAHILTGDAGIMAPYASSSMTFKSESKTQMDAHLSNTQDITALYTQGTQGLRIAGVNYVSLRGRVTKKSDGKGVSGLTAYMGSVSGVATDSTDKDGYFEFFLVAAGRPYELTFQENNGFQPNIYPPYTKGFPILGSYSAAKTGVLNADAVINFVIADDGSTPTPDPDPTTPPGGEINPIGIKGNTFKVLPNAPKIGKKISFAATLVNQGTSAQSNVVATLTLGNGLTSSKSKVSLAPKKTFAARWSRYYVTATRGMHTATLCVTAQGVTAAPNCRTIQFEVK